MELPGNELINLFQTKFFQFSQVFKKRVQDNFWSSVSSDIINGLIYYSVHVIYKHVFIQLKRRLWKFSRFEKLQKLF